MKLNLQIEDPPISTGFAHAYQIEAESQFVPGNLGDAFLGDFVIESDRLKAVFARPGKPQMGVVQPGTLMDITAGSKSVDYTGGLNTSVNPETTGSLAYYTRIEIPKSEGKKTTASLRLTGHIGDPGYETPSPDESIAVLTDVSIAPGSPVLQLTTTFTNETTRTAWITPADVIDWGEAMVFTEASGYAATTASASFAIATADDFSVAYFTSGTRPLDGLFAGRDMVALAEPGQLDYAAYLTARRPATPASGSTLPAEFLEIGASNQPGPGLVMFPGTESRYVTGMSSLPQLEPIYVPASRLRYEDGKPTITLSRRTVPSLFDDTHATKTATIALQPGASYTFKRFLRSGNSNWAPSALNAYQSKDIVTGILAGAVVEARTNNRIANAHVLISGGPTWDGASPAPAILQITTREDGTFAAKVPPGKYVAEPKTIGRRSVTEPTPLTVEPGEKPAIAALTMSRESVLRVAISEAETPTSSPLPVKVTIQAKPPYPDENYGFSHNVDHGIRNTRYLPQGAAVFPLTPGRYRVVISRGIEYDILEKDIAISPGQEVTITGALPHLMKDRLPGMVSMDAGLLTDASGTGYATADTRAIQAACEGVQIIVSGDYDHVTDLQTAIRNQGLGRWVKAFPGRRALLHKDDLTADLFVYPLNEETSRTLDTALKEADGLPPDVALADLKKKLPNLIFEISRPTHPEAGYLNPFPFNLNKMQFPEGNMPPPDFNAFQILEGKKLGLDRETYSRYIGLQMGRLDPNALQKASPLSPTGGSFSRLPYGQEVGYPRTYLYLNKSKPLDQVTDSDIISAVRGQHFMVTNGPILLFDALNYNSMKFDVTPGSIVDLSTTEVLRIRAQVLAAPWVNLAGINTRDNGDVGVVVQNIIQSENVLRYPAYGSKVGVNVYTRYLKSDSIVDALAFGNQTLEPVVPNPIKDFGGELFPYAWSAPIFVDRDGDGKITIPSKEQ